MSALRSTSVVARLARCVELFRDPEAKDAQKAEFRALVEALESGPFTLRDEGGSILVNGAPVQAADVGALQQRLALHNVSEVAVPRGTPPLEVFELVKAIAAQPLGDEIPVRLRAAGAQYIVVVLATTAPVIPPSEPVARPSSLGTEGILRGEPMTDIASPAVRVAGVPVITYDPAPPPADVSLPVEGLGGPPETVPSEAAPSPLPPEPPPPSLSMDSTPAAPTRALSGSAAVLQALTRDPQGMGRDDSLAALGQEADTALRGNRIEEVLAIAVAIVRLEQRVTDESARRQYGIALRRLLPKATLQRFAQFVSVPGRRADAVTVLRRGGADGVEILLDVLAKARSVGERRGAFDALRQMTEGTDQLVQMLDHPEWFVVRNVAELVGEMGLEAAVPALARRLAHPDERVRKAAALALAKIGTSGAAEALRRALRDKSPDVRMQVALGVGGRRSSSIAMSLVVALDEEKEEAVRRELILALGRIATPDAVQALIKVAQPKRRLFGHGPTALRLAAVEGLRLAGSAVAVGTLEDLGEDGDRQVSAAAKAALEELRKTRKKTPPPPPPPPSPRS